jgi:hypothetical protein
MKYYIRILTRHGRDDRMEIREQLRIDFVGFVEMWAAEHGVLHHGVYVTDLESYGPGHNRIAEIVGDLGGEITCIFEMIVPGIRYSIKTINLLIRSWASLVARDFIDVQVEVEAADYDESAPLEPRDSSPMIMSSPPSPPSPTSSSTVYSTINPVMSDNFDWLMQEDISNART